VDAINGIRDKIGSLLGEASADTTRILYGGSVNAENIGEFMAAGGIDGALVGGASLKVDSFARIIEETAKARSSR
jgi:triosephosphate isomerase